MLLFISIMGCQQAPEELAKKPPNIIYILADDMGYPDLGYYDSEIQTPHLDRLAIEDDDDKPFFIYLAYTAPHWPLHALPEDIAKYKGKYQMGWDDLRLQRWQKMKELGVISKDTPLSERSPDLPAWEEIADEDRGTWDTRMAHYAEVIDRMDQGLGKIIQKLEQKEN